MITRLEIQNYKALKDVAIDLTPIHVLIGPNDSGKTSILEALQILSRTLDMPIPAALPRRLPTEILTFGDLSSRLQFVVSFRTSPEASENMAYRLLIHPKGKDWEAQDWIWPVGPSSEIEVTNTVYREKTGAYGWVRKSAGDPQKVSNTTIGAFYYLGQSIRGIQTYRWIPRHLALPVGLNADRKYRMDETGFGLPTLLDDILSSNRKDFDTLEQRFQEIFPEIESINTPTQRGYASHPSNGSEAPDVDGKGLELKFKHIEKPLSAMSVSDGYLIILAYLALQYTPEPPPMLLIEEPENGIHPKRLESVVRMLRSLTEREGGPQILLTTHSPYLLDQFKPEEVTLCTKGEDGTVSTMRMSDSKAVQKQRGIFTLGEIWGGEGEDGILGRKKVNRAASE